MFHAVNEKQTTELNSFRGKKGKNVCHVGKHVQNATHITYPHKYKSSLAYSSLGSVLDWRPFESIPLTLRRQFTPKDCFTECDESNGGHKVTAVQLYHCRTSFPGQGTSVQKFLKTRKCMYSVAKIHNQVRLERKV